MKHNFMTKMVSALLAVVLSTAAFSITAFASGGEESTESVAEQETAGDVSDLLSVLAGSQVTVSVAEDGIQFSSGENGSGQTGTVTTGGGNLNVRTGAGMDYTAFTQLPNGTTVKVIGTDGDWLKVILPEKVGYVYSGYMTVSDGKAGSGEGSFSLDAETLENLLGMLGGVALALLCLCFVLPLLMAADDGFASLLSGFVGRLAAWFSGWRDSWTEFVVKVFFALPTALYLYGLVYGAVRGRRACVYDKKEMCAVQRGLRFAPRSTVLTALFVLCAVYLLFISMQAKYLFGAFWGALPEGFSYSEYARQGFFELCRVAAINIVILLAANVMSRAQAAENCLLRVCNTALSALTLLLLATAAAKMALYIAAYGLTVKRVLASVFLVWMACVFVCVILRQFRTVALVRVAVFLGAVLFALLCVLPVGDGISTYNAARVQAGTLDPDVMEQELRPLV